MASTLSRVNSLKITFLVDNSIEWMTKFPPGFTSEVGAHLFQQKPPIDPRTNVPILDLENYCCGAHGFAALIETQVDGADPHTILFDTGPDSRSLIRNIQAMQTPINPIERVVISHWHSDHSGGLLSFLDYRASESSPQRLFPVIVDVHPDRPIARGIAPPPTYRNVIGRIPEDPSFDSIHRAGGVVETHNEGHVVAGGTVYVSGEIPRITDFEGGLLGGVRWYENGSAGGEWVNEENIMDERYATVDVLGKGLVIFSACSHAGIVNVAKDAIKTFKRPIHMVIGGFHLAGPEFQDRIQPTVDFLSSKMRPACTYILPMHCSGFAAKVALRAALGESCVPAGVGVGVHVQGDGAVDHLVHPPTIV
ncbi:hypothetical protein BD410DRAFT_577471 [Rickenella mellea]|uniref:Metallo-beta-lactamase domain-containing protein n=1 Tax=Rickenella mellea TaxID=50990 RepID=A0A4Y7QFW1_9AGAM|nr:hypothetical protein BD410DRAFT_577471 [Rickenella mellea]